MGLNFGDKPTTTTGTQLGQYPEWMKKDMLEAQDAYKRLYESNLKRGYRPYTGMTTAGFTPEQIASQQGLASLVGSQAPIQQEALGLTRGVTSEFTPDQAQKYMSPYLRASLDSQKAAAQRQFEGTKLPQLEAEAVAAGGMSGLGSRAGVQAAEMASVQQRLLADIETKGQQKAYQDAQQAFEDQKRRERDLASDISTMGQNIFSSGLAEQGLLKGIGEEKRELAQSGLDEAYMKYMEQKQFPEQQLARYMASIYGNPVLSQPNYRTSATPAQASKAKSLIGLGLSGIKNLGGGSYSKGFSNFTQGIGNFFNPRGASGGQVGGLNTLYRKTGGDIEIIDETEFQTGADRQPEEIVAAREAVAGTAIPISDAPNILAEADKITEAKRVANLSPSEKALEDYKKNPMASILLSKEERDKRSKEQAKIMNEALAKQEKLSTDRQVDAFLVGFLKPFGTPASGVANISKVQLERYKTMDKIKDTQAVKEAAELMQNLKETYPETVQQKVYNAYQKIFASKQSARKKAAEIKKLNAQILELRAKALDAARGKPTSLLKEDELDSYENAFEIIGDKMGIDIGDLKDYGTTKENLFNSAEKIRRQQGISMQDAIAQVMINLKK